MAGGLASRNPLRNMELLRAQRQRTSSTRVMKSEERHHLAQNDLQASLNRGLDKIEPYSNQILFGVVAVTVLVVATIVWARSSRELAGAGWTELSSARTPEDLVRLAEDYPSSNVVPWANLQAAKAFYIRGVNSSLTNRKSSDDDLKQAKELYGKVLNSKAPPEVREPALEGMGLTLEAQSGSDPADAIKAYETLIKEFPNSTFRNYAAHRVEELKKPASQEFYAWFRKQNPKPADRPLPTDGKSALPVETPAFPNLDDAGKKDETAKKDEKPVATEPAKESTPPATTDGAAKPPMTDAAPKPPVSSVPPLPATDSVTPPAPPATPATPAPETPKPVDAPK